MAAALNLGLGTVPQLSSLLRAACGAQERRKTLIRSIHHVLEPVEAHPGRDYA